MPHFDDTVPYRKPKKSLVDILEEKRQAFNEHREKRRFGTLPGLEDLILKMKRQQKKEAQDADRGGR